MLRVRKFDAQKKCWLVTYSGEVGQDYLMKKSKKGTIDGGQKKPVWQKSLSDKLKAENFVAKEALNLCQNFSLRNHMKTSA